MGGLYQIWERILMSKMPRVVVVGRTNVGKSSLFNRMAPHVKSLILDQEGVTRDYVSDIVEWNNFKFELLDTGGIDLCKGADFITCQVTEKVKKVLASATILLFVVDLKTGITDQDERIARLLQELKKPVFVLVNKVDSRELDNDIFEFAQFGFNHVFPVSAAHGRGVADVMDMIVYDAQKIDISNQVIDEDPEFKVAFLGRPNAGKSSLMNLLVQEDFSIVSDIPGTTRDLLEAELKLGGLHFRLVDTAGIRETTEIVEQEGIRRSHQALEEADLILLVLDAEKGIQKEDRTLLELAPSEKTVIVWNKTDLPTTHLRPENGIDISAKEGIGLDLLKEKIDQKIWKGGPPSKQEVVITNVRHKEALDDAILSIVQVIEGLKGRISAEFVAADMRRALVSLGVIIGADVTEEILSAIFSKFCVGK